MKQFLFVLNHPSKPTNYTEFYPNSIKTGVQTDATSAEFN